MANLSDQVRIVTPIDRLWRKDVKVDQGLLSAKADNGISIVLNEVGLADGQWVVMTAAGEVDLAGATGANLSYMVFRGGADRSDNTATESVTILKGEYEAYSKVYDSGGTFALGTELAAKNGQLEEAGSGDFVIGFAHGAPANSELHFDTYNAGYVKA